MATEQQMTDKVKKQAEQEAEKKHLSQQLRRTLRQLWDSATWEQTVELCMVQLYATLASSPLAHTSRRVLRALRNAYVWRTCANLGFNDRITIVSQFNAGFAEVGITNDLRAQLLLAYFSLANACARQDSFDSNVKERRGGRPPRRRGRRCYAHYPTNLCASVKCLAYRRTASHIVDGIAYLRSELHASSRL